MKYADKINLDDLLFDMFQIESELFKVKHNYSGVNKMLKDKKKKSFLTEKDIYISFLVKFFQSSSVLH